MVQASEHPNDCDREECVVEVGNHEVAVVKINV